MYKKIIFTVIFIITVAGIFSCRKDETNVLPTSQISSNYPKSLSDVESFLVPGYSNFRNANLYGYQFLPIMLSYDHTFCSQNSTGNNFGVQGGDFLTNNININNTPNTALFSQLYQGVAAMNTFFDRAGYYERTYGDTTAVKPMIGEGLFLRSYYFYLLECLYGEKYIDMTQPRDPAVLGIPMPLQFATSTTTNLPRSAAYDVWAQIITDLKTSAQDLHNFTYPSGENGRITEWAADAMLGKAYMFTKQYDSAKVYLLKVINNTAFSLPPYSTYSNSFNGNTANDFNSESLFEINVERQPTQASILFSSSVNQALTTNAGELWAPTIIDALGVAASGNGDGNGGASGNMGMGYCKFFVHDKCLQRFGFTLPVYTYRANPNANGGVAGTGSAANPDYIMDSVSYYTSLADRTNNAVDPRLFVCAMEPWVDKCEQPYEVSLNVPPNPANEYPDTIAVGKANIINTERSSYWGWSFKKYATIDNTLYAYGGNDGSDLILLRLADVYLLYAEACMKQPDALGATSDGLKYLNRVHNRAFGASAPFDVAPAGVTDYVTFNDATMAAGKNADGTTDLLHTNPLMYERYVELFGEGAWFFDVCRWGIGSNEANYYYYGASEFDPVANTGPANSLIDAGNWSSGPDSKAYHFPIPSTEIATNPDIQSNNDGY